jgi:hypothetical protein
LANISPINISVSFIWKQIALSPSLAPAGAFPIVPGYRKLGCVDNRWLSTGGGNENDGL